MCKCCSDGKGFNRNKHYEFLHAHTHGHDPVAHGCGHKHADEPNDLENHKVVSDPHRRKQEPHQEA